MEIGEKGICRLSVVPLRKKGSDRSEMVSQLLFGEHYEVIDLSKHKSWLFIRVHADGYEGWIDAKQHTSISNDYFDQISHSDYKVCTDLSSSILFKKHHIHILLGSILPIATNELFKMEEQLAFNGESKSLSQKRDYEFLKSIALKYLNTPYLWGGKSPFGIDCSGFVQVVYRVSGYQLYRDAYQQADQGELVEDLDSAAPGDLAFFHNSEGKITHVGILMEDKSIIHASGKVRVDQIDDKGIFNTEINQYTHFLFSIRRILKQ